MVLGFNKDFSGSKKFPKNTDGGKKIWKNTYFKEDISIKFVKFPNISLRPKSQTFIFFVMFLFNSKMYERKKKYRQIKIEIFKLARLNSKEDSWIFLNFKKSL